MTTRIERRLFKKHARRLAAGRPLVMTPIPTSRWNLKIRPQPIQAWESQKFLAQLYAEQHVDGQPCLRLSVNRVTVTVDGKWEDNLTWDELMQVKAECGFADFYGLEVYPRERDIVNVSNMRHLWLFGKGFQIGWFEDTPRPDPGAPQ